MQERLERGQVVTARVHTPMQFATQNSPHRTALTLSLAITSNKKHREGGEEEEATSALHSVIVL